MVALIQSRSLELYKKQTFKTCHFNEGRLLLASLTLSIIIQKNAPLIVDVLQKESINHMLRLGCCLPPPIKISGYAPGSQWKALGSVAGVRCWRPPVTGRQVTVFLLRSLCLCR